MKPYFLPRKKVLIFNLFLVHTTSKADRKQMMLLQENDLAIKEHAHKVLNM